MDKRYFKNSVSSPERFMCDIQFGDIGSVAIDQTPAALANINPRTGFPYSDIQKIMIQTDVAERRRLLDNLPSFKADFLDDNVTDEQALSMLCPPSMQLPSEYAEEVSRRVNESFDKKSRDVERAEREQLLKDISDIHESNKDK